LVSILTHFASFVGEIHTYPKMAVGNQSSNLKQADYLECCFYAYLFYGSQVPVHPGGFGEDVQAERDHEGDAGHRQGRRPECMTSCTSHERESHEMDLIFNDMMHSYRLG